MHLINRLIHSALIITVFLTLPIMAQSWGNHGDGDRCGQHDHNSSQGDWNCDGHWDPDSLIQVTVSGTAIVDNSTMYPMYYLDQDGDGIADFHLNFGPHWYTPDSSEAVRPADGQQITISGGSHESYMDSLSVIVVYEIGGQFWRDPVAPSWNYMGGHHNGGHHGGQGFAFGWMHDSLRNVEVTGTVLTDSTMNFTQFYLDTDQDTAPDYFLNFGPPWYVPASGATRPTEGGSVTIIGGSMNNHDIPMLIVYDINGQVWRDSTKFGGHFGGGWMHKGMDSARYFHSPFDSLDGVQVYPGWYGEMGQGHMGMMADSLFCQILEVFPQNIPNRDEQHVLAGYEVALFNPDGTNNMWMDGMHGGHMNFNSDVDFRLHYNDIQLLGENIVETSIRVKYWDDASSNWITVDNATVNTQDNTVSFSSSEVSNYVVLTGTENATALEDSRDYTVKDFTLNQNYPNPFNPVTTISFDLQNSGFVTLNIYNVLGQKISSLLNETMSSGVHSVTFNGRNIPSGIYYYELVTNGQNLVRKMNLLK